MKTTIKIFLLISGAWINFVSLESVINQKYSGYFGILVGLVVIYASMPKKKILKSAKLPKN